MAAFSGTYSTTRIVVEKPSVIESLTQLISSETALPIFYNQQSRVSDGFSRASSDSLEGQLWLKLMRSQTNLKTHIIDSVPLEFRGYAVKMFHEIQLNGSVIIANGEIGQVFVNTICSSSPEDELWHFVTSLIDENEVLVGWPFHETFHTTKKTRIKIRHYLESGIFLFLFLRTIEIAFNLGWTLSGTTLRHKLMQQRICTDSLPSATALPSGEIKINYYETSSYLFLIIYIFAFVCLLAEIIHSKKRRKTLK